MFMIVGDKNNKEKKSLLCEKEMAQPQGESSQSQNATNILAAARDWWSSSVSLCHGLAGGILVTDQCYGALWALCCVPEQIKQCISQQASNNFSHPLGTLLISWTDHSNVQSMCINSLSMCIQTIFLILWTLCWLAEQTTVMSNQCAPTASQCASNHFSHPMDALLTSWTDHSNV